MANFIRARQRSLTSMTPHKNNPRVIVPSRGLLFPLRVSNLDGGWQQDGPREFFYNQANNPGIQFPAITFHQVAPGVKYNLECDITDFTALAVPAVNVNLVGRLGVVSTPDMFNINNLDQPAPFFLQASGNAGDENGTFRFVISDNNTVSSVRIENFRFEAEA